MKERLHKVLALFLMGALLTVTLGLAVPNINVSVQELGNGSCDLKSPVQWANVHLVWATRRNTMTLEAIEVYFSDDLPRGTEIRLLLRITGYHSFWDNTPSTDLISNVTTLPADLNSGEVISLTPNGTYSYWVFPLFGFPVPSVENVTIVLVGGQSICPGGIVLSVQNIGVGSTSYSPPPVSLTQINVTVNNLGGPELKDYVLNFTVSSSCIPDLSKVYVTDSSGNPLYFWAFNDSENGKIWFWVNYTVPANSVSNVTIHLNGTGTSSYFDPYKVFWNFTEGLTVSQYQLFEIYVNLSKMEDLGYSGYAMEFLPALDIPLNNYPGPMFLTFYQYRRRRHYLYGLGLNYWISFSTASFSFQLGSVTLAGTSLDQLGLWDYAIINEDAPVSPVGVYSVVADNSTKNVALYMNGTFVGSSNVNRNSVLVSPLIGQYTANDQSYYPWVGVRPYLSSAPAISVPADCTGSFGGRDYTFTLYFRP